MKTEIYLGKSDISSVQFNAAVIYGENNLRGWRTRSKGNAAINRISGDGNMIGSRINLVNDPDLIDMLVKTTK